MAHTPRRARRAAGHSLRRAPSAAHRPPPTRRPPAHRPSPRCGWAARPVGSAGGWRRTGRRSGRCASRSAVPSRFTSGATTAATSGCRCAGGTAPQSSCRARPTPAPPSAWPTMRPASSRRAPATPAAAIPTLAATVTATPRPQPASAPPTQLDRSRRPRAGGRAAARLARRRDGRVGAGQAAQHPLRRWGEAGGPSTLAPWHRRLLSGLACCIEASAMDAQLTPRRGGRVLEVLVEERRSGGEIWRKKKSGTHTSRDRTQVPSLPWVVRFLSFRTQVTARTPRPPCGAPLAGRVRASHTLEHNTLRLRCEYSVSGMVVGKTTASSWSCVPNRKRLQCRMCVWSGASLGTTRHPSVRRQQPNGSPNPWRLHRGDRATRGRRGGVNGVSPARAA